MIDEVFVPKTKLAKLLWAAAIDAADEDSPTLDEQLAELGDSDDCDG